MEPVAVGLIGAGPWARMAHAPMLAKSPHTRLAGVWARRPEAATTSSLEGVDAADCSEVLGRVFFFLDNELDEADCSAVRLHLDACNPCLERYDLQRTVKAIVVRSCSEPAPDEVRRRVLMRIREVQVRITDV